MLQINHSSIIHSGPAAAAEYICRRTSHHVVFLSRNQWHIHSVTEPPWLPLSAQENHHVAASWSLLREERHWFLGERLPHKARDYMRRKVIDTVLATDMKQASVVSTANDVVGTYRGNC